MDYSAKQMHHINRCYSSRQLALNVSKRVNWKVGFTAWQVRRRCHLINIQQHETHDAVQHQRDRRQLENDEFTQTSW